MSIPETSEPQSAPRPEASGGGLRRLLFPDRPRDFRGRRGVKIAARAAHVLAAGTFTASHLFALAPETRLPWLAATVATGAAILLLDLVESAAFLLQVRGLVVVSKVALLAALPAFGAAGGVVLAALVVASVVFSHAPSRVRYFLLVGRGRIQGSQTRG